MEWYILFSDRIILTSKTARHGLHVIFGPYTTREKAESDIDNQMKTFKKNNKALYHLMLPVSTAVFCVEE